MASIINPEAASFMKIFEGNRQVNRDVYAGISNISLDIEIYSGADTARQTIAHQVRVTRDYIDSIKEGTLKFGRKYEDLEEEKTNLFTIDELLALLDESTKQVEDLLGDPNIGKIMVQTNDGVLRALQIWGLNGHEQAHHGWCWALLGGLRLERPKSTRMMYGE